MEVLPIRLSLPVAPEIDEASRKRDEIFKLRTYSSSEPSQLYFFRLKLQHFAKDKPKVSHVNNMPLNDHTASQSILNIISGNFYLLQKATGQ